MITVYDDAPEQNKELKERGTTDAGRLCLRAVGEPLGVRVAQKRKKGLIFGAVCKRELMAGFSAELNILTLAAYKRACSRCDSVTLEGKQHSVVF